MKTKRRYREKIPGLFVSVRKGHRIHDFLKGWGTVDKDGSVLWDQWRPLTKSQREKALKWSSERLTCPKITFPAIKGYTFPSLTAQDILDVQPLTNK